MSDLSKMPNSYLKEIKDWLDFGIISCLVLAVVLIAYLAGLSIAWLLLGAVFAGLIYMGVKAMDVKEEITTRRINGKYEDF